MNLKGNYDDSVTYSADDVVLFTDGVSYVLQHPCPAGTPPVDTRYWNRTSQGINDVVKLCVDAVAMANSDDLSLEDDLTQSTAGKKALDAHQGKVLKGLIDAITVPDNIGPSSIVLNSSTESSTKQFLLTIADPGIGEDPELTITEIVPDTPAAEESET
jgi:hypothetical protein